MDIQIQELANINLFDILGLDENDLNFNKKKLKKKYNELVIKYHPDKNSENEDMFELINLAYNILSNDEMKELYIEMRKNGMVNDFNNLKKQAWDNKVIEVSSKPYNELEEELNKKHGINVKIDDKYTEDELKQKIMEAEKDRETLDKVLEQQKKISKKEFNDYFDSYQRETNDKSDAIIEYNTNTFLLNGVTQYDNLYDVGPAQYEDNFELQNVGKYVENNLSLEERMKQYYSEGEELCKN